MNNIKELNIPELERALKHNEKENDRIDRERERLEKALTQRLAERYHFKVNDIIVGQAIVFNEKRNIVAKVYNIFKDFDYDRKKIDIKVSAYTAREKNYVFSIKTIRKANDIEIKEFKNRVDKW